MFVIQVKKEHDTWYAVWVSSLGKRYLAPTSGTPNGAAQWKSYSGALNALDKHRDSLSKHGETSVVEIDPDDLKYDYFNVGDQIIIAQLDANQNQISNSHWDVITRRAFTSFSVGDSAYQIETVSDLEFPYAYRISGGEFAFINEENLEKFRVKQSINSIIKQIKNLPYTHQLEKDLKRVIENNQENEKR